MNKITNIFKSLKRVYSKKNEQVDYGIKYNHSKVSKFMHLTNFDYYYNLLSSVLLTSGKTILYLASGTEELERYKNLEGYSNIILVDYEFVEDITVVNYGDNKRIIQLNLDAYIAIQVLLKVNHTVNTIVVLNEGINMGGGNVTLAETALSMLFPIMSQESLFIGSRIYYKKSQIYKPAKKKNWVNLPFEQRKVLKPVDKLNYDSDDELYINPDFFTTYNFCKGIGEVILLKKKITTIHTFRRGRINVHVLHSSMYNHMDKFDLGLTLFENGFQEEVIRTGINNVLNWKGTYNCSKRVNRDTTIDKQYNLNNLDELNQLCVDYNIKSLGLIPNGSDYLQLVDNLNAMQNSIENIYFFHLNHGDFKSLYAIE